jgi:hypothetical protein
MNMLGSDAPPSRARLRTKEWGSKEWQQAEKWAFILMDKRLGPEWEIFHEPSLAQARPDFVLVSKKHGAVIIEVKNWDITNLKVKAAKDGFPMLYQRNRTWLRNEDPISQLNRYRIGLLERCHDQNSNYQLEPEIVLIMFHESNTRPAMEKLISNIRKIVDSKYNVQPMLICGNDIRNNSFDIEKMLPPELPNEMSGKMWNLLNFSLGSLDDIDIPGFDWELNNQQKNLIYNRTESGLRRVRGVAGSGKSVVIANRAIELAKEGKDVLVICFNLTLVNLLHLMAIKAARNRGKRALDDFNRISFTHFHGWVKDIAYWTSNRDSYKEWLSSKIQMSKKNIGPESIRIQDWIKNTEFEHRMYDAILVDEGQDFCFEWWDALRMTLRPDGEMMLVADENQDLYGRSANWTEEKMLGSGFKGTWNTLQNAYRFPLEYYQLLSSYCDEFLEGKSKPMAPSNQKTLFDSMDLLEIKWLDLHGRDISSVEVLPELVHEVESYLQGNAILDDGNVISESVLLVDRNKVGKNIVESLDSNIEIQHTFSSNSATKMAFTHHRSRLKATTFHSFKGWEASNLIICVSSSFQKTHFKAFYTALTRLKPSTFGKKSTLLVLCGDKRFTEWYTKYQSS